MTHHTDAELLPCPFCGCAAHFEMDDDRWEWIECGSCGMEGNRSASLMEDCKPKLAEAWNRRAPAAPVPQGWKLVPDDANMTDEQAEAICAVAKVCGGGAYDIYRAALAAAPKPPEAAPVPQFSRIAQKKLDYLLEAGEAITGYAIENKDGRRGAIDCHGFVYWWQDAAAPQQLANHDIQEQST